MNGIMFVSFVTLVKGFNHIIKWKYAFFFFPSLSYIDLTTFLLPRNNRARFLKKCKI